MSGALIIDIAAYPFEGIVGSSLRQWAHQDADLKQHVEIHVLPIQTVISVARISLSLQLRDGSANIKMPPSSFIDFAVEIIARQAPALVGFTCYVWSIDIVSQMARSLKKRLPETKILFGGPEVAPIPEQTLDANPDVDFVVYADEGEEPFRKLLRHLYLKEEGGLSSIPGLAYRHEGKTCKNMAPPWIDLSLAPPIHSAAPAQFKTTHALVEASRGCSFTCTYCDWGERQMRFSPLSKIGLEFRALARAGTEFIFLTDADILMNRQRGADILRLFIAETQSTSCVLYFNANPLFLSREIADILALAPQKFQLSLGVQSTNPEVLKRIHRAFDKNRVLENIDYFKKAAPLAKFGFQLIFGLPGDDLDGFRRSLNWVFKTHPCLVELSPLMVLPGAAVSRQAEYYAIKHLNVPYYEVLETNTMSSTDIFRAKELCLYIHCLIGLFPDIIDPKCFFAPTTATEEFHYIERIESWIAFLKSNGLDLSLPNSSNRDRFDISLARQRLREDPVLFASIAAATQKFLTQRLLPSRPHAPCALSR